jgi:hypothetical protein
MSVVASRIKENERKTKMETTSLGKLLELAEANGFKTTAEQYASVAAALYTVANREDIERIAEFYKSEMGK